MPNVDESAVPAVTNAALAAFERDYGDGSGASVVWGPNVISDWALIGVENNSGAASARMFFCHGKMASGR